MSHNEKNTIELSFFIYPDKKEGAFVGVCLQMNIVKVASDVESVKRELVDAVLGTIKLVEAGKLSPRVLNNPAPNEYWERALRSAPRRRRVSRAAQASMPPFPSFLQNTTATRVEQDLCPV